VEVDGRKHPNDQGNSHRTMNSFHITLFVLQCNAWQSGQHLLAAAVAVFAIFAFFHVIVHVFSAKLLSNSTFIAYLCFRWALSLFHNEFSTDISSKLPACNPFGTSLHKMESGVFFHSRYLRSSRPLHLPLPEANWPLARHRWR
jgi:hypothetical protein